MAKSPFNVEVEIRGTNRVRNQIRAAASAHTKHTDPVIGKHAKKQSAMLRALAYPAKLPNQKYRRKFELKRKYRAQKKAAAVWKVINRRKGAVWVIKKGMQNLKYHFGRWYTMEDELTKTMPELTKNLSVMLENLMEKQTN